MPDIDLDKVLGAMENENVANNAMSLTDMLDTANKVLGQVTMLMDKFEKMGLKPLLVRGMGAKLGVDAEKPLATDNVVVPRTETHKELYDQLNNMGEEQLRELFNNGGTQTDKPATDTD
jgi:uncharacterized membrane-anchored protein